MNLEEITLKVCEIAKETAVFIKNEVSKIKSEDIEVKGLHNFVTYVDFTSQEKLIAELSKLLPEAGYIVEEETTKQTSDNLNWIIDPLDGTTNFIHGVPFFSISIALMEKQKIISGVVYEINLDECFYAWEGGKAFLNGKEIHVSSRKTLNESLLATGFPYYDYKYMRKYIDLFEYFMQYTSGVRRLGSAAVDLAYVACGRFEGFYEYSLNAWDVAAGAFIVQQAGGKVSDFKGGDDYIFGKEMIATNAFVFEEMKEVVGKFFK